MAYAVVVSLKRTVEPLLDSGRSRIKIPSTELQLIYSNLCEIQSFFDKMISLQDDKSVENLEKKIKDELQNAQDLIEIYLSDLFHSESETSGAESSISAFTAEMVKVKQNLGSLTEMLKAKEGQLTATGDRRRSVVKAKQDDEYLQSPTGVFAKSDHHFGSDDRIVGLDDETIMLKERLLEGYSNNLKVISVVGMAGIGKTTLVKEVYHSSHIIEHFDTRLYVNVGVKYQLDILLLRLLSQLDSEQVKELTVYELAEKLFKHVYSRRFLIVLDDIWDSWVWDKLQHYLPDNSNGSAIILTTRLTDMAVRACSKENILQKIFLRDDQSWDLLRKIAIPDMEDGCPVELEQVGKTIVENLGGLPLAVVVIGGLLSNAPRTVESWNAVAQDISSSIQIAIFPIIRNSFYALPQRLKACFLYLGVFPPHYNIPVSQLFKLWVAEGFIEPVASDQSLEQNAEEYLEELVSSSLVMVGERGSRGRIRTCRVHVVLQPLCVSEAQKEKVFYLVKEVTGNSPPPGTNDQRRLGFQSNRVLGFKQVHSLMDSVTDTRSLLCVGHHQQQRLKVYLGFKWLRVLHAPSVIFLKFPDEVARLYRLRYLAITCDGELPPSISRLRNLEVLIVHRSQIFQQYSSIMLPIEIWKLHKLRHIECMGYDLPDPPPAETKSASSSSLVLKRLLTLSGVSAQSCTERVLAGMPVLSKLVIRFDPTHHAVDNLCEDAPFIHLHHLESFKCVVVSPGLPSEAANSLTVFPSGLRKLTLSGCGFEWDEHMRIISLLPQLEVLKLLGLAFCGSEWTLREGGFPQLKFLLLEELDIEQLLAESDYYFPRLEKLIIRRCCDLQEIPAEIGEITTLRVIEVHDCSMSVVESAQYIQEEQLDYGNESLQVWIH